MKKCKRCSRELADSRFGVTRKKGRVYPRSVCKDCNNGNKCIAVVPLETERPHEQADKEDSLPENEPGFEITEDPVSVAVKAHEDAAAKRDLKREHSALVEELKRRDRLIAELGRLNQPLTTIIYNKPSWERSDSVACAFASDWHVEEPVDRAAVHGLNEFNLEIAKTRAHFFFINTLKLTDMFARESTIRTLWLGLGGDFFSGSIHEELIANNLLAPGDAANFVAGLICSGIDYWLNNSDYTIEIDAVPGNHGRMTKHVFHGDPTGTSLETFMYRMVALRYRDNPRVRFNVAEQAMVYRHFFERFTMRIIHGYEVKFGGGVGGLTIPLRKALAQWNNPIRADLTVLGHFHQFFDGGDFIVNGSLIGYNEFAQAIKASYEEPKQAFWLVNARKGGQKSVTAPVWLDSEHKTKVTSYE